MPRSLLVEDHVRPGFLPGEATPSAEPPAPALAPADPPPSSLPPVGSEGGLSPEQLAFRRSFTGSSEIAAVAGLHPHRNVFDIYSEKLGLAAPWEDNEHALWGRVLEDPIAREYARRQGVELENPGTLPHPTFKRVCATPDRIVLVKGRRDRVLEVKTADARLREHWGEEGTDDVPEHYLIQCTWEMGVAELPRADLAVLLGGNELRIYHLVFDPDLFRTLVDLNDQFWEQHIVPRIPPAIDGSSSAREYLKRRFPRVTGPMLEAPHEAHIIAEALRVARAQLKEAEELKAKAENELKALIGEAQGVRAERWQAKWTECKGRVSTDWEAIARELGATPDLIAQHTTRGESYRRFTFKHDLEKAQED